MIVDNFSKFRWNNDDGRSKKYQSVWRDPVRFKYKGYDIISMSFPSSGGVILGQMMKAIENFDLSKLNIIHLNMFNYLLRLREEHLLTEVI